MASSSDQATFAVNLGGNAGDVATQVSSAMEALRTRIAGSTGAIKEMQASLRNLRGASDEVRAAKDQLKAKLDAERAALSAATLEQLKQGKAYEKGATDAKKLTDSKKKLGDQDKKVEGSSKALTAALRAAGGPIASLKDKAESLKDIFSEGGTASGLLTLGVAGLVAVVAALATALVSAGAALGAFILKSADAARSAGLLREAAFGANAQWGKNFGEQVSALAKKVPTAKAELDKLGISLAKNNIGGQLWVDTMNAVAQASAALGDDAGNKIKEFVERGRLLNRMQINPMELIGTGVSFDEVAAQLAKSMHVGINDAKAALFEGRVKLADGAKALRDAVEKKFAGINLRQMLSFPNLVKKFGEAIDELTKDVDLEPMLLAIKDIAKAFGLNTTAGNALKNIVTDIGNGLVKTFVASAPMIKKFVYGLIIGALHVELSYLRLRKTFRDTFGDSKALEGIDLMTTALMAGRFAVEGIAVVFEVLRGTLLGIKAGVDAVVSLGDAIESLSTKILDAEDSWIDAGGQLVDGFVTGIKNGIARAESAVGDLASAAKNKLRSILDMHSPSKVFASLGKNTAEGYALGIESGTDRTSDAVATMASPPKASGGASGGAGGMSIAVNVEINVNAGSNAQEIAAAVSSGSVLEQFTKAIVDAVHGAGAGVPA